MIIFDLACEHEHRFEGWFHSSQDFEKQLESGMLSCPQCSSPSLRKVPSVVSIASSRTEQRTESSEEESPSRAITPPASATQMIGLYRQLTQAILAISEDVGTSFAEEARRIHYQESPERPIRGQATSKECEELGEEGIAVMQIPMIKEEDLN
ncbi:MAG: hypothetical protein BWY57_00119 [Betaproteobacteria bacterium ADurb.Bin341]|nr:MAG: hypothetical protein BWY57_00119 [Betaproteobacteria bacterium ADurb.Bin341]